MCGIVGQIAFSDRQVGKREESVIRQLMALMARRGPDDEGLWSDEERCVLGILSPVCLGPLPRRPSTYADRRWPLRHRIQW